MLGDANNEGKKVRTLQTSSKSGHDMKEKMKVASSNLR